MRFSVRFSSRAEGLSAVCEWTVFVLLFLSLLWRGGKSLDMTWILVLVSCFVTFLSFYHDRTNAKKMEKSVLQVPSMIWCALMLFLTLTVVSFFYSETRNYGLDEVFRTASFVLLFLWTLRRSTHDDEGIAFRSRVIRAIAVSAITACVIGVLVYVFQPVNRFVGTFFDHRFHTDYWPNAWADFLLLCWPLVLYWLLRDTQFDRKDVRGRLELLLRSVVMGFVFGCFFLSYSRGAVIAFGVQLLLWGGIIYIKTKPKFPIVVTLPVMILVTVVAASTFTAVNLLRSQLYEVQEVSEKITFEADEGTSSISERQQFWTQALTLTAQKPFLGWGPYSFRFVQPALQDGILQTSDHAHNVFLKLMVERGIPAAFTFLFLVGIVLLIVFRLLLSSETEFGTLQFSVRMLSFLGLTGLMVHSLIDYNLQFVGIAAPFWMVLAILLSFLDLPNISKSLATPVRTFEVFLAGLLLACAVYEGSYLALTSVGRHAEAQGNTEKALFWYRLADGEVFSRDLHLSKARILFEDSDFNHAQFALDHYFATNRQDSRAWKRQGDVALLRGEKARALDAYKKAYEKGKWNDLSILHGLLEAYLALDQKQTIVEQKESFDVLLASYATAIQRNEHFIALSPNVEEFIAISNVLARLFPDDAPKYEVMAAKVDHNATRERERIAARPPGFLW